MQNLSLSWCAVGFEAAAGCFAQGTWHPRLVLCLPPQYASSPEQ